MKTLLALFLFLSAPLLSVERVVFQFPEGEEWELVHSTAWTSGDRYLSVKSYQDEELFDLDSLVAYFTEWENYTLLEADSTSALLLKYDEGVTLFRTLTTPHSHHFFFYIDYASQDLPEAWLEAFKSAVVSAE